MHCEYCGTTNQTTAIACSVCQNPLRTSVIDTPPELPPLLKGRYYIIACIGRGGFGSVYKAHDMVFKGALVAIKEISLRSLTAQEIIEATGAFNREVQVLSDLKHPNLPHMYDHFMGSERWYLVMDFIEGETLAHYLEQTIGGHFLSVADALNIGMQLCTVLDYMHTRQPGIIFRDLKPTNVMLTPHGHIYLIDFGISRLFKPGQATDTMALGSPGYAAPEQYGKAQTTARADIYSLGVMLHQMLTGHDPSDMPFRFAPLQTCNLGFPSTPPIHMLDMLLMQMIEMDPDKRPGSMALVKQQLQYIAEQLHDPTGNF